MDAGKMVHLAKHWTTVPPQRRCEVKGPENNRYFDIFGVLVVLLGSRVDLLAILLLTTVQ